MRTDLQDAFHRNRILKSLTAKAFREFLPSAKLTALKLRQVLWEPESQIHTVYFPVTAVISVLSVMADGRSAEAIPIGCEGLVGGQTLLGSRISFGRATVHYAGEAVAVSADEVTQLTESGPTTDRIRTFGEYLLSALIKTAGCNLLHASESRLAKWILLLAERTDQTEIPMTHDMMSEMIGVHRPQISRALRNLKKAGGIDYRRRRLIVRQPRGLEKVACECYQSIGIELRRFIEADDYACSSVRS